LNNRKLLNSSTRHVCWRRASLFKISFSRAEVKLIATLLYWNQQLYL